MPRGQQTHQDTMQYLLSACAITPSNAQNCWQQAAVAAVCACLHVCSNTCTCNRSLSAYSLMTAVAAAAVGISANITHHAQRNCQLVNWSTVAILCFVWPPFTTPPPHPPMSLGRPPSSLERPRGSPSSGPMPGQQHLWSTPNCCSHRKTSPLFHSPWQQLVEAGLVAGWVAVQLQATAVMLHGLLGEPRLLCPPVGACSSHGNHHSRRSSSRDSSSSLQLPRRLTAGQGSVLVALGPCHWLDRAVQGVP